MPEFDAILKLTMIENFGSYLKSERELRGVPLEEVSETTKIHVRFLHALENNQFDDLPGEVFVKGYIRSFAKVIGADENEMLSAYDEIRKKTSSDGENESVPIKDKTETDKSFSFLLGLAIIFLAGLGWGTNVLFKKSAEQTKQSQPLTLESDKNKIEKLNTKNSSDSTKEVENGLPSLKNEVMFPSILETTTKSKNKMEQQLNSLSGKPIQSPENFTETETKKNTPLALTVIPKITGDVLNDRNDEGISASVSEMDMPLKLAIIVRDNVWFNIKVDKSPGVDFILPKGAARTFHGKDEFIITVGNRQMVDLELNDQTLNIPDGDENSVVHEFIINSQLIN